MTPSQFGFYLIFIIRLPFPSPGSLNTSYTTSATSFPISVPQFPHLSHKVSVNINELGWHLKQCLAHSELCLNVLILKTEVISTGTHYYSKYFKISIFICFFPPLVYGLHQFK